MKNLLEGSISPRRVRVSLFAVAGLLLLGMGAGLTAVRRLSRDLPSPERILTIEPARKTLVLGADGSIIHEFFVENRTIVTLDRIPRRLQEAVVAIEDRRFYTHYGLDMKRFVKIVWVNLTSSSSPGASTITQQLARNLFLTLDKTVTRKVKEMILALQLEQTYSKDEILAMYLNQVNFGSGAYGVQAAARTFFGKDVWDLQDGESTMLAGMIQLPEAYSPLHNLERAYRRRTTVLESMVATGALSRDEARSINQVRVVVRDGRRRSTTPSFAPHFVEEIRQHLEARYGFEGLYTDGLRVTTTLVPRYQHWLEEAAAKHLERYEQESRYPMTKARYDALAAVGKRPARVEYLMGACVLLDTRTGAVLALHGSRDYDDYQFNLAMQAQRQPGSIFKPVVYLTALTRGYTPCSILMDTPVALNTGAGLWQPHNFDNKYLGPITLRYGLSHSRNVVAARLIDDVGVVPVIETARRLGITSELPPVLSLSLGAGEINLVEMVSAYASFGNHGVRVEPYLITRVETADGEVLEEGGVRQREVLDPATAWLMADLMTSTLTEGTARAAPRYGFTKTAAGKTGTYNEYTDAWFVGFTPSFAAGVWVGFDTKVSMGRAGTGAHMALPIWAELMGKVTSEGPDEPFPRPEGIVQKRVCLLTGLLATTGCDSMAAEYFLADGFPRRACDRHGGALLGPVEGWVEPAPRELRDVELEDEF
ncbi:MAG: hypothetical protein C0395_01005 [Gemmatimonas sp.]|nr:hypothetical protein [Gemmatimonas sp.]